MGQDRIISVLNGLSSYYKLIKDNHIGLMQRRKVCRYFQRGSCRKDNCPFVHIKQNRKVCAYFQQDSCRKGNQCNFYHPPKEEQKLNTLKQQLKKQNKEKYQKKQEPSSQEQIEYENKIVEHNMEEEKEEVEPKEEQKREEKNEQAQIEEKLQVNIQEKIEVRLSQLGLQEKIQKIDFLLGLNKENEQSSSSSEQEQQEQTKKKQELQFLLTYPKKFPDLSRTPVVKKLVADKQLVLFQGKKYLDLISGIQDEHLKEYYQIIRKFTDTFELGQEKFHYIIKMRPLLYQKQMVTHFDFKQDTLDLFIDAERYPKGKAIIKVTNQSIPHNYKQKIAGIISKYHEKGSLFNTLKYIQNNFEKIYDESKFKLQNQYYSLKQMERKERQQKKMKRMEVMGQKPVQAEVKKRKPRREDENRHKDVIVNKFKEGQKIENLNYDYEINVQSMVFNNCQYAVLEKALIYIECLCEKKFMYILDATKERSLKVGVKLICRKCQSVMVVGLQREVVQVKKQVLGRFGINNGHIIDIGGVSFKIGCSCTSQISKNKLYLPGERIPSNCHTCFKVMNLSYNGLKLYNPTLKVPQIVTDKQLPNKGCCKHMKLSFRWFRFGCCGRCFSCDDCHLMQSVNVHEKLRGITMLCGFCSREQAISNECLYCHKQLVKGVQKSGHWQGGYGCRDQALLSRKDNKKYAGLTKKNKNEQK